MFCMIKKYKIPSIYVKRLAYNGAEIEILDILL